MKITGVKAFVVDGGPRARTFVKLETDQGLAGWGDCTKWDAYDGVVAMVQHMAPLVIGRDPMHVERLWSTAQDRSRPRAWPHFPSAMSQEVPAVAVDAGGRLPGGRRVSG